MSYTLPEISFADEKLTSFAGLVIFQVLFDRLRLKERLKRCFTPGKGSPMCGMATITVLLIVHILIGFRRLRDVEYYGDDPMVLRVLGLRRAPSVATLSRARREGRGVRTGARPVALPCVRADRATCPFAQLTLDFDGSVFSTRTHAEGTAVGMNKRRKGARSYYPLFCTVAKRGQFFDTLHRPGNVHDSNETDEFIPECLEAVRAATPGTVLESRLDSAFFSQNTAIMIEDQEVEFTASVPFERFPKLKHLIEERRRWCRIDSTWSYFEADWKSKSWPEGYDFRFLFYRRKSRIIHKGSVQLDLFLPDTYEYEYKGVVTNKRVSAKKVLRFHNGRGAQEGIFGEAKTHASLGYIPTRAKASNQLYMMAAILAHNMTRELQMSISKPARGTTEKAPPDGYFSIWVPCAIAS
ncbi:MAG: IS1380 family transposase [bacterium]